MTADPTSEIRLYMTEQEFKSRVLPLKSAMYSVALRMGIPPDEAADAVQDTLIGLWRASDRIPGDAAEGRAYCMRAFRNCCISALRRRRENISLEAASAFVAACSDRTEYADTRRQIGVLIDSLPAGQRDAIRLTAFGDMDSGEVARATGQTEANVRQLLSRGRRRLRELMSKM